MSDAAEKTAGGATRSLFGSLGFILLMVGVEGMTTQASIQVGVGVVLIIAGSACVYAAFFWEYAKTILSDNAQKSLNSFAQHPVVRFGMIALVLETLISSHFIEQHRWPFSYPADPSVISENANMKIAVSKANDALVREKELADKWRFATVLRRSRACGYQLHITSKASSTVGFWSELLQYGGWDEKAGAVALAPSPGSTPSGITIRIKNDSISTQCAGNLQRALTDIYPNPPSRVANNQQSDFLNSCVNCVQIEIDY